MPKIAAKLTAKTTPKPAFKAAPPIVWLDEATPPQALRNPQLELESAELADDAADGVGEHAGGDGGEQEDFEEVEQSEVEPGPWDNMVEESHPEGQVFPDGAAPQDVGPEAKDDAEEESNSEDENVVYQAQSPSPERRPGDSPCYYNTAWATREQAKQEAATGDLTKLA